MERTPVRSRLIRAIGYAPAEKILEVQFPDNSIHRYHHVPADVYRAFMAAESLGRFHNDYLRNVYNYELIV